MYRNPVLSGGEIVKTIMKGAIRDQKGQVLIMALILLIVGGLIIAPLLGLMSTGLLAGQVYEKKTDELYAADAGVEDAIWKIQNQVDELPYVCGDLPWSYDYETSYVNDKHLHVYIYYLSEGNHRITSVATSDDGTSTTIEAYVSASYLDLSPLLDNAIVSDTHISIKNGVNVIGPVTSGGTVDDKSGVPGPITENVELNWPSSEDLKAYYLDDVKDLEPPFPYSDPLDIAGADITLEALYREGSWTIYNGSNTAGTVTLNGTVYVKGDLELGAEKKDFTLNLNNQTIFVESASANAIEIKDKCTIIGSGCIIAVGDVYFGPNGDAGSEDDFVLVMSVDGTTTLQPSGTFYGCIAGNVCVDVKSGNNATVIHTAPEGKGLDFPGMGDGDELPLITELRIDSWEIIK